MWRRLLALSLLALLLGLAGCAAVDHSRDNNQGGENIPWNSRADWEGKTLGVPY